MGAAQLLFVLNFFWSLRAGRRAAANPWEVGTLEWTVASPPPHHNFDQHPASCADRTSSATRPCARARADWLAQAEVIEDASADAPADGEAVDEPADDGACPGAGAARIDARSGWRSSWARRDAVRGAVPAPTPSCARRRRLAAAGRRPSRGAPPPSTPWLLVAASLALRAGPARAARLVRSAPRFWPPRRCSGVHLVATRSRLQAPAAWGSTVFFALSGPARAARLAGLVRAGPARQPARPPRFGCRSTGTSCWRLGAGLPGGVRAVRRGPPLSLFVALARSRRRRPAACGEGPAAVHRAAHAGRPVVTPAALEHGREVYTHFCRPCHGDAGDGKGHGGGGPRRRRRAISASASTSSRRSPPASSPATPTSSAPSAAACTARRCWPGTFPRRSSTILIEYVKSFSPRWQTETAGEPLVASARSLDRTRVRRRRARQARLSRPRPVRGRLPPRLRDQAGDLRLHQGAHRERWTCASSAPITEHPELLEVLTPPNAHRGERVVDMQHFMLQHQRTEITRLKDAATQPGLGDARQPREPERASMRAVLAIFARAELRAADPDRHHRSRRAARCRRRHHRASNRRAGARRGCRITACRSSSPARSTPCSAPSATCCC